MFSFWENKGNVCSSLRKWATFLCKTCTGDFVWSLFSSAVVHTVRGAWAKCWTALRRKRTEWALWRWHKSRGESTINVNAFWVFSTSLIRPSFVINSVNRFLCSLMRWTYLLTMITLKGFFCLWDVSLSVARPDPSPPVLVLLSLSFLRPCLDQQKSRAVLQVLRDIFDGVLLVNLLCALKGEEMQFGKKILFFLPVIHIHPEQAHAAHLQHWEQSCTQDLYAYIISEQKCSTCCVYLLQLVSLFLLAWQNNRTDQ